MRLRLQKPSLADKDKICKMLEEWRRDIEINKTDGSPRAIFKNDCQDFQNYIDGLEDKKDPSKGKVAAITLFAYDDEIEDYVGAVNIRLELNEYLLDFGGHIGDGIRPSQRRKGYATEMIGLALKECRSRGIDRVLMTCYKDNVGSARSIMNNGGVLENEVDHDGKIMQRYWIDLL